MTAAITTTTRCLRLGALNATTNQYVLPAQADKDTPYKCPECAARVIFRQGAVRVAHFAHHVSSNPCTYYTHPSESQIHKDAKMLMVKLLKDKRNIQFWWKCSNYMRYPCSEEYYFSEEPTFEYKDGDEIVTEYRSPDGKWIADVAIVNAGVVRLIIEIRHTHTTTTPRPEPWYELDATEFLLLINEHYTPGSEWFEFINDKDFMFILSCERPIKRYCCGSFCWREPWVPKIPRYDTKFSWNNCLICNKEDYEPVINGWTDDQIRVCHDCLKKDVFDKKLRRFVSWA